MLVGRSRGSSHKYSLPAQKQHVPLLQHHQQLSSSSPRKENHTDTVQVLSWVFRPQGCSTKTKLSPAKAQHWGPTEQPIPPKEHGKDAAEDEHHISPHTDPGATRPPGLLPASSGQAPGSLVSHTCARGPVQHGGTEQGPGGVIAGLLCLARRLGGAGRAAGRLPGSAAHFKVCKAKREAPELF